MFPSVEIVQGRRLWTLRGSSRQVNWAARQSEKDYIFGGSAEGIEGHFVQAAWKHLSRRASTWLGLQSALRRQHSGGLRASFQSWKWKPAQSSLKTLVHMFSCPPGRLHPFLQDKEDGKGILWTGTWTSEWEIQADVGWLGWRETVQISDSSGNRLEMNIRLSILPEYAAAAYSVHSMRISNFKKKIPFVTSVLVPT